MAFNTDTELRTEAVAARSQPLAPGDDVFDTRPRLTVVPPTVCGDRVNDWVCVSRQHPSNQNHYYVKADRA